MDLYRKTYAEIDLDNVKFNVSHVIEKYNNYKYYFGVVKADCYSHGDLLTVKSIIESGCNYLAVATLDEALFIRSKFVDIPILCLGNISCEFLDVCNDNDITVTVNSLSYANEIAKFNLKSLKVHIKINTGMNRLGISSKEEFNKVYDILKKQGFVVEGIFTHMYNADDIFVTNKQVSMFNEIIGDVNKEEIKIIHISASDAIVNYEKLDFVNGCRLGIIMYGLVNNKSLNLKSTFKLVSTVIQINTLKKGDSVGYNGIYSAFCDNERIAVVPIGYADGVIRKNTGRNVYINGKEFPIVGNICMDMLFVKVDDDVNLGDEVLILKDNRHIQEVANYLETISYEVLCTIGKRVPRIYIKEK